MYIWRSNVKYIEFKLIENTFISLLVINSVVEQIDWKKKQNKIKLKFYAASSKN